MPRALKNLDITLGLAAIPVQLLTATTLLWLILGFAGTAHARADPQPSWNDAPVKQGIVRFVQVAVPEVKSRRMERRGAAAGTVSADRTG
jgi:hypothetical protein